MVLIIMMKYYKLLMVLWLQEVI